MADRPGDLAIALRAVPGTPSATDPSDEVVSPDATAGLDDEVVSPDATGGLEDAIRARVRELIDDEPTPRELELVNRLLGGFCTNAPDALTRLADVVAVGDASAAVGVAHTLTGAAGNVGATMPARLSGDFETLARTGRLTAAESDLATMRHELDRVVAPSPLCVAGSISRTVVDAAAEALVPAL